MYIALSIPPRPGRPDGVMLLTQAATYSTDSAGTLHMYRMREYREDVPCQYGGYHTVTRTEPEEFLTLPRGAYEAVLAGDTREERDLLVSMFTAREPQG